MRKQLETPNKFNELKYLKDQLKMAETARDSYKAKLHRLRKDTGQLMHEVRNNSKTVHVVNSEVFKKLEQKKSIVGGQ